LSPFKREEGFADALAAIEQTIEKTSKEFGIPSVSLALVKEKAL
jgi:hypothetical protein